MGQARLYKRLRKEAGVKFESISVRKYVKAAFLHLPHNCARAIYQRLKRAQR